MTRAIAASLTTLLAVACSRAPEPAPSKVPGGLTASQQVEIGDFPSAVEVSAVALAGAPKVETRYEIESPDDPAKVAAMLRNAKNGCWVRAAVANPTPFEETLTLNGEPFSLD